jgi:hypothetical protein
MNTHGQKIEVYCQRDAWFRGVRFWLKQTNWSPDRITRALALPLTFKEQTPEDESVMQPEAFRLGDEQAQAFMDELWRVGFRPTEGSGSAGSLAATERHLNDMRALVFKTKQP